MLRRVFPKKPKIAEKSADKVKTALVHTAGTLARTSKSPDEAMGDLFKEVQEKQIYPDGKSFVDMLPRGRAREIRKEYLIAKQDPTFDLREFVNRHFYEFQLPHETATYHPTAETTAREHVTHLWEGLRRRNRKNRGSLIALPYQYIVPGGRFQEQFYWDSYFVMLGLAADGEWDAIRNMVRNHVYLLRKYNLIPTANRTYFLSRSQPPFFAPMVKLLARNDGRTRTYAEYLPSLLAEYRFWMKGKRAALNHREYPAYARVVRMPNGMVLNRYYDNKVTPRPESQREDIETATRAKSHDPDKIFLDLRAGAESGWDFSSRWFHDPNKIDSIHTTDFVPVDLNALLYILESTIADAYTRIKQPLLAKKFHKLAERRAHAIKGYCWNEDVKFFCDYDFRSGKTSDAVTLAGVFPLYAKIATSAQASAVAHKLSKEFLKKGGLVTTLETTGQQWDAPNGWAPLHWIAVQGLKEYGYYELAHEITKRWLKTNEQVFAKHRKMIEKYNVEDTDTLGAGGEYPLQDGFGWTNGVYAALKDEMSDA